MSHPTIKNAPARLYLVLGSDFIDGEVEFSSLSEVTWCEDRQEAYDPEYVRADVAAAEIGDLQEEIERLTGLLATQLDIRLSVLNEAISSISDNAAVLRECHTNAHGEWGSDTDAREVYERDMRIVSDLQAIVAGQTDAPAAAAALEYVDLQGLSERLLAPRPVVRDEDGYLTHPAFPVCDEDMRADKFLAAFGIESYFVPMDGDADPEFVEHYFDDDEADCSTWTPTPPEGEGWSLLAIYPTEDGPYALFARREVPETNRQRRERERTEALAAQPAPGAVGDAKPGEQIAALIKKNPPGELGPSDEPESQYRLGYNTAIEDALIILENGGQS